MSESARVYLIDDDEAVRTSVSLLLESEGIAVECFPDAESFLGQVTEATAGCVVTDLHMPGRSGLELQESLAQRGISLPLLMLTGHGDVPAAVRSLKAGAMDFLEKPVEPERLICEVRRALALDLQRREQAQLDRSRQDRIARLTPREREVVERVARGNSNKVVAADLEISERTVELHRGRAMRKLEIRSVPELVRTLAHDDEAAG